MDFDEKIISKRLKHMLKTAKKNIVRKPVTYSALHVQGKPTPSNHLPGTFNVTLRLLYLWLASNLDLNNNFKQ